MPINLPILVTLSRVALILPLAALVAMGAPGWLSGGLFVFAWLTDWLDGHLARARGETSRFGAFLDPVADKLLVIAVAIMVAWEQSTLWFSAPVVLIVCREVAVVALREWMATLGRRDQVAVAGHGKSKTALEFAALTLFLFAGPGDGALAWLAWPTLYAACALALFSMLRYFQAAAADLRLNPSPEPEAGG